MLVLLWTDQDMQRRLSDFVSSKSIGVENIIRFRPSISPYEEDRSAWFYDKYARNADFPVSIWQVHLSVPSTSSQTRGFSDALPVAFAVFAIPTILVNGMKMKDH